MLCPLIVQRRASDEECGAARCEDHTPLTTQKARDREEEEEFFNH